MAELFEVRGLTKVLGSTRVLRGVDLEIAGGDHLSLTGRSGSGKSTLLKLLAGLDRPTSGVVRFEGVDLATLDDDALAEIRLRKIGLLFQSPMLLPDLSAAENVALPLQLAGLSKKDAAVRVSELLGLVGVENLAAKRPNALSGGEAQRVSIARSLANRPSVVIADEPTTGLDRANAENVLNALDRINRELGTTIIVATHDPLAIARGTRSLELDEGTARWVDPQRATTIL